VRRRTAQPGWAGASRTSNTAVSRGAECVTATSKRLDGGMKKGAHCQYAVEAISQAGPWRFTRLGRRASSPSSSSLPPASSNPAKDAFDWLRTQCSRTPDRTQQRFLRAALHRAFRASLVKQFVMAISPPVGMKMAGRTAARAWRGLFSDQADEKGGPALIRCFVRLSTHHEHRSS
jgi:hypothetical protein